ncbi:MAG TPA: T9SS type A sorting domain-containing protein [Bacteroidales bacterium]|nr:T9SS type A sorting domain-containing protein [Bacteroidales bacterium]HPS17557.1 T9SS type A sorting domain-containing protein [Bacteroidales bacterium]
MKIKYIIITTIVILFFCNFLTAQNTNYKTPYKLLDATQPMWKFWLAFEDATGAKDTIWAIWDTLATSSGVDTLFGEGAIHMNYNNFNVFIGNSNGDTTKVSALDFLGSHQLSVQAINYQYPISISWDTSLFHAPLPFPIGCISSARIDNDYFFLVNNDPLLQAYNMLLDNNVPAPFFSWGTQSQFPMNFIISYNPVGVNELFKNENSIFIFPNPFKNKLTIKSQIPISAIEVFTTDGKSVYSEKNIKMNKFYNYELIINKIKPAFYIIKITNELNQITYEKIIKS